MKKHQEQDSDSDWDSMSEAPPVPKPRLDKENSIDGKDEAPGSDFKEALNEAVPAKQPEKKPTFRFSLLKKYEPEPTIPEEGTPHGSRSGERKKAPKSEANSDHDDDRRDAESTATPEPRSLRGSFRLPPLGLSSNSAPKQKDEPKPRQHAASNSSVTKPNQQQPKEPTHVRSGVSLRPPVVHHDDYDDDFSTRVEVDPVESEAEKDEQLKRGIDAAFASLRSTLLTAVWIFLAILRAGVSGVLAPLVFGLLALVGDHVLAPGLRVLRVSLIAPVAGFLRDMAGFIRDASDPLWQGLGSLFRSIALVIGAFRLVEVHYGPQCSRCSRLTERLHEV